MRSAGKTDIGLVRKANEDSYLCESFSTNEKALNDSCMLYIVADGMGGHNAGEVASLMAVQEITQYMQEKYKNLQKDEKKIFDLIKDAVLYANDKIYKKSILNSDCVGMGTTLSMAFVTGNSLYIGHVGDSRIYLIRENKISKLTEDHSLVAELVKNGTIKPEEANNHPQKNVITRALGTEFTTEVDINCFDIQSGDYLVLCSDGLSNLVSDEEIMEIVTDEPEIQNTCEKLINSAKDKGGYDNITVIVVEINEGGDTDDR